MCDICSSLSQLTSPMRTLRTNIWLPIDSKLYLQNSSEFGRLVGIHKCNSSYIYDDCLVQYTYDQSLRAA